MFSSGHCCLYLFRVLFGTRGFPYSSLLFLSFVFVRGASALRTESLVKGLSSSTRAETRLQLTFAASFLFFILPQLFFSVGFIFRYRNAVCILRFMLEP